MWNAFLLALWLLFVATPAFAEGGIRIAGVIVSTIPGKSLVTLGEETTSEQIYTPPPPASYSYREPQLNFYHDENPVEEGDDYEGEVEEEPVMFPAPAVYYEDFKPMEVKREGETFKKYLIVAIHYRYVTLSLEGKELKVLVGDTFNERDFSGIPYYPSESTPSSITNALPELEKQDRQITITQQYKEHLLAPNQLGKILMQASATPAISPTGEMLGFRLTGIEAGSIYEVVGLRDGDTITAVNDTPLRDAGQAVKLLLSLKGESSWRIDYERGGVADVLNIRLSATD